MRSFKVEPQKRGPRGEGRTKIYKPLQLPEDVIDDLKLYQSEYGMFLAEDVDDNGNIIPVHFTLEQMLNRWMDNVKRFDKEIYDAVQATKKFREKLNLGPKYPVDPTDCDVWEMTYIAERDGEELDLFVDEELAFVAIVGGEKIGVEALMNAEWEIMNEAGIELTLEQARIISKKILQHNRTAKR